MNSMYFIGYLLLYFLLYDVTIATNLQVSILSLHLPICDYCNFNLRDSVVPQNRRKLLSYILRFINLFFNFINMEVIGYFLLHLSSYNK